MKKLAIASALIAGVGVQQPLRAQVWLTAETPSITSVYSMIFYQSPGPWEKLPIRLNLTPAEIKDLVPARSGKFAMIGMTCSGISANKHLEGCKINAEPKDAGYEAVGSELAKRVVVDPAFSMDSKSAVKFISLQFRIVNSDAPDVSGPCWPPSCILEPAPPPPPPRK